MDGRVGLQDTPAPDISFRALMMPWVNVGSWMAWATSSI